MRRLVLVLLGCLVFAPARATAFERVDGPPLTLREEFTWRGYRNFTTADGLPNQTILSLAQGSDGRVYAGTDAGLARYDGVRWESVRLPTVRPTVSSLLALGDSMLIGTWETGLFRLDHDSDAVLPIQAPALRAPIFDLAAAADGRYWVANGGALQLCREDRCESYAPASAMLVYRVLPASWQGHEVLWLGLENQGVRRIDAPLADQPRLSDFVLAKADGLPNGAIRSLATWGGERGDDLWIGTGRGIARWNGATLTVYGAGNGFPTAMVFDFQPGASRSGNPQLYAALRPGGLATFRDDGSWILQGLATGVPSNDLHTLLVSEVGGSHRTLWIGSIDAGIARRDPGQFSLLDERYGLPSRYVHGVGFSQFPDGERSFWVGTAGGARRWRRGGWEAFVPEAYAERMVRDVIGVGSRLWIATDRQLLQLRDERVVEYNVDNSALPAVGVNAIAAQGGPDAETVYAATGHGLARWRADEGLVLQALGGEKHGAVASVATDAQDRVWLVQSGAVWRSAGEDFVPVVVPCLQQDRIYNLFPHTARDGVGRIWLATRNGLIRFEADDPERCHFYPFADQLGSVGGVTIDAAEHLFAFGSRGALRMPLDATDLDDPRVERFERADGLVASQLHPGRALWSDRDGRLYAATASGLVGFEPEGEWEAGPAPRLQFDGAWRGDGESIGVGAEIPAGLNAVRVEYRLLSYEREHRIRYEVGLEGPISAAPSWKAAPFQTYERLPAGDYRLTVRARAASGSLFGPLHFPFRVLAPWWQTRWALAGFAVLLVASGLGFGRWRARATERRARDLAREVAERTHELAAANAQLERASLTDPLTGLGNRRQFELASRGELDRVRRRVESGEVRARSLLMLLDLDHFKRINDSLGHAAGDQVLVATARRLESCARSGDAVARLGGEEFVLLARDVDPSAVPSLLRRLLGTISDSAIDLGHGEYHITTSIGTVLLPDGVPDDGGFELALSIADDALYTAKHAGRDRACLILGSGETLTLGGRRARVIARQEESVGHDAAAATRRE